VRQETVIDRKSDHQAAYVGAPVSKSPAPHFETPASDENRAPAIALCITSRRQITILSLRN
jgi:hypothetical protein